MNTVSPHAFISTEALQPRLKRAQGAEDDVEQRLTDAINAATLWMAMTTRRALKARNYRTAVAKTCSATSASQTMTGSGFTNDLKVGDDVVGTGVEVGTQVSAIASATSLTLSRKTTAAITNGSITFGSRPFRVSGEGGQDLYLPERPLVELYNLYWTDGSGNDVALDFSTALYDYDLGRIRLVQGGGFSRGSLNIRAEARCGYAQPSATDRGNVEWYALEQIAFRVAEVFYLDALNLRGRTDSFSAGSLSAQLSSTAMPADVINAILPFVRRW